MSNREERRKNQNASNNSNNQRNQNYNSPNEITKTILILSVILSFMVGLISGYFIGESRAESRTGYVVKNPTQSETDGGTNNDSKVDYSQYVINASKGVTIDNFYGDEDTKAVAANLIGSEMPKLKWKDSNNKEHSTDELGDNYVVEFFSTTCPYCIQTIPEFNQFKKESKYKTVSLTSETNVSEGLKQFNVDSENAFTFTPSTTKEQQLISNIYWIPGFVFVKNGKIALVAFGAVDAETLHSYSELAFE